MKTFIGGDHSKRDSDRDLTTKILVRKDSAIASLADLAGKTVAVGAHSHAAFELAHGLGVLAQAVERRSRMLASVSGLSPYVHDALVVMSAGGVTPANIRQGAACVAELHREMDRERLVSLGFDSEQASALSAYHTKNFM